ncbi:redoxin domain-containing protein [Capsulimonas corticalis]|nr:redoxin domain-containing protein [Capsulimonas corticalis]
MNAPCFSSILTMIGLAAMAATAPSAPVPVDLAGARCPIPSPRAKATVLFFVAHDCPIANAYAPEINRIVGGYSPKQMAFRVVYVETDAGDGVLKKHAKDYGFRCPEVHDSGHRLVTLTGAATTPEAVVLSASGKVLYRGRIDDQYAGFGLRRNAPKHRDLRNALDSIAQGRPVSIARTPVLGCAIPPLH